MHDIRRSGAFGALRKGVHVRKVAHRAGLGKTSDESVYRGLSEGPNGFTINRDPPVATRKFRTPGEKRSRRTVGGKIMKTPWKVRSRLLAVGLGCLAAVALPSCAPYVSLAFHPDRLPPPPVNYSSRIPYRFGFVPFVDDRYIPVGSDDFYLIGWGTGTGTLETRSNVSRFVTESYVRSFRHLGLDATTVTIKGLEAPEDVGRYLAQITSRYPDIRYLVAGVIKDFQFQISHPRFNPGPEFSILATGVAWVKCQERIELQVYSAISGRQVGQFTVKIYTIRQTKGKDQNEFIRSAEQTLDRNLGTIVMKSVGNIDSILRSAPSS